MKKRSRISRKCVFSQSCMMKPKLELHFRKVNFKLYFEIFISWRKALLLPKPFLLTFDQKYCKFEKRDKRLLSLWNFIYQLPIFSFLFSTAFFKDKLIWGLSNVEKIFWFLSYAFRFNELTFISNVEILFLVPLSLSLWVGEKLVIKLSILNFQLKVRKQILIFLKY